MPAMLKFKKMMVSRIGNTKAGRAEVQKRLGDNAQVMVDAMLSATEKLAGEELAEDFNKDLLKLVLKVAFLWQEGQITAADAEPARDSVTSLAQTLMEYLSRPAGDIDCTDVCHMIHAVKDEAIPIVQPHMTEKNWTKIGTLAGFYGSPDFASFFLNDPEVAPERSAFLEVLQAQLPESSRRQVCSVVGCFLPRCTLTGSMFCFPHHALKFYAPPSLEDFLRNSHYCALFREWLVSEQPERLPVLEFYFKAEDYSEVRSRATLASRAPGIVRKHLAEDARQRADLGDWANDAELQGLLQEVQGALSGSTPPKSTLFQPLQRRALGALRDLFEGAFKASAAYGAWADENTGLPLPQMPAARAALLEQLGISQEDAYGVVKRTQAGATQEAAGAGAASGGSAAPAGAAAAGGSASLADAFLTTAQKAGADGADSSALASYDESRRTSSVAGAAAAPAETIPMGEVRPPPAPASGAAAQ